MAAWPPPDGWVIPSQPRIPVRSSYVAHHAAGPSAIEGSVRVLCDEWLRVSKPIRPKPNTPYCLACARLVPREPHQLTIFDALEAMT